MVGIITKSEFLKKRQVYKNQGEGLFVPPEVPRSGEEGAKLTRYGTQEDYEERKQY